MIHFWKELSTLASISALSVFLLSAHLLICSFSPKSLVSSLSQKRCISLEAGTRRPNTDIPSEGRGLTPNGFNRGMILKKCKFGIVRNMLLRDFRGGSGEGVGLRGWERCWSGRLSEEPTHPATHRAAPQWALEGSRRACFGLLSLQDGGGGGRETVQIKAPPWASQTFGQEYNSQKNNFKAKSFLLRTWPCIYLLVSSPYADSWSAEIKATRRPHFMGLQGWRGKAGSTCGSCKEQIQIAQSC